MFDQRYIRRPAVAGAFYPFQPAKLEQQLRMFLDEARPYVTDLPVPKAIIAPHAGYVYSGHVAAYVYALLEKFRFETIVLIGISHRYPISSKVAIYDRGAFKTPLGTIDIDTDLAKKIIAHDPKLFNFIPEAHASEHSLEVQLPFLQFLYSDLKILPLLANNLSTTTVIGEALHSVSNEKMLIIASSDLSHFPNYDDAVQIDSESLKKIESGDPEALILHNRHWEGKNVSELHTCMCGETPIVATMRYANLEGAKSIKILKYANSGDVSIGDKLQVVGYGAVAFFN